MKLRTLQEYIRKAALKLDEVYPLWWTKITRPIQIQSQCECVLGQLAGSYYSQQNKPLADTLGFNPYCQGSIGTKFTKMLPSYYIGFSETRETMNRLWEHQVKIRKGKPLLVHMGSPWGEYYIDNYTIHEHYIEGNFDTKNIFEKTKKLLPNKGHFYITPKNGDSYYLRSAKPLLKGLPK